MLIFAGKDILPLSDVSEKDKGSVAITEPLLANKRSSNGEIIVTLFEDCNLTCKFCNQDHNSLIGLDTIRDKVQDVIRNFEILIKMRKTSFTVNIMGGEIFQDKFDDSVFSDMEYLAVSINNWCAERDIPLEIGFVSNLVHMNTIRVKRFIDDLRLQGLNVSICTSYDPHSRFNSTTIEIFRKNAEIYKDYLTTVNVVLTAPNIEKFLKGNTKYFDYLYENFEIFFDYYTPEDNHKLNDPTDVQLRDMYIFIANNYPNSNPIKGWFENERNSMTCQSTLTIMPDGNSGRCTVLLSPKDRAKATDTAADMEEKFITKMDCMSCEYFSRCGLGCYLQQHFNGANRKLNDCWMKEVHKEIDNVTNR